MTTAIHDIPHSRQAVTRRGTTTLRTLLVATAAVVLGVLAGCGSSDDGTGSAGGGPDLANGEEVYSDSCASCHGGDFEGTPLGPSHLDAAFADQETSDEDYRTAITEGADEDRYDLGNMPAQRGLDDQQITDVIAYVRSVQEDRGLNG